MFQQSDCKMKRNELWHTAIYFDLRAAIVCICWKRVRLVWNKSFEKLIPLCHRAIAIAQRDSWTNVFSRSADVERFSTTNNNSVLFFFYCTIWRQLFYHKLIFPKEILIFCWFSCMSVGFNHKVNGFFLLSLSPSHEKSRWQHFCSTKKSLLRLNCDNKIYKRKTKPKVPLKLEFLSGCMSANDTASS